MLKRRDLLIALSGVALASGCAALRPVAGFRSDRISVVSIGAGPDVVLIPGLATSRDVWRGTVERVAGYRFHLIQVRGFAGEPPGANVKPGPLLELLASEISRYILEQRLTNVAVVGHSLGGTLALMTAANLPTRVSKTMVVDNVPFGAMLFSGPDVTQAEAQAIGAKARQRLFGLGWKATMPDVYSSMIGNYAERPTYIAQAQASDGDVAGRLFEEVASMDLRSRMSKITGPVRVLYVGGSKTKSEQDPADALYRAAYRDLPNASLKRVVKSRHFIMLDQPETFSDELRRFLR